MKTILTAIVHSALQGTAMPQWSNDPTVNTVLDKSGDQRPVGPVVKEVM